jgi:hypothetical protein
MSFLLNTYVLHAATSDLSFGGRGGLNPKPFETLRSFLRLNPSNVETQKNEVLNQNNVH